MKCSALRLLGPRDTSAAWVSESPPSVSPMRRRRGYPSRLLLRTAAHRNQLRRQASRRRPRLLRLQPQRGHRQRQRRRLPRPQRRDKIISTHCRSLRRLLATGGRRQQVTVANMAAVTRMTLVTRMEHVTRMAPVTRMEHVTRMALVTSDSARHSDGPCDLDGACHLADACLTSSTLVHIFALPSCCFFVLCILIDERWPVHINLCLISAYLPPTQKPKSPYTRYSC